MTTSEGLIKRACDVAVSLGDKGMVAEATVVMTLVSEYRVAVQQALQLETTIHEITKPD